MKKTTRNHILWISAFAVIYGIVVGLSAMMSAYSSRYMIMTEVSHLDHFVANIGSRRLIGISLSPPYVKRNKDEISEFFTETFSDRKIITARLWLRDGYVELDKSGSPAFKDQEPGKKVLKAFESPPSAGYRLFTEEVAPEIRSKNETEKENDGAAEETRPAGKKRLAVFIPIYSEYSGRVNAVVEIVKDAEAIIAPVRRVQTMIWLITVLGLGFYPSLLILANVLYKKRKDAEIELIKAKQLEAINSMVVTFNHEVNQPLTGICTYAELLKKNVKDDEELTRYAEKILSQSIRLGELVHKLRDITRVEITQYLGDTKMVDLTKSTENRPQEPPTPPSNPE